MSKVGAKGDLELAAVIEPHGGASLMVIIFALGDLLPNHWTANFDFGGCLNEGDEVVKRAVSLANAHSASTDDIKFFAEHCGLGPDNEFWSYEVIPIAIESFNFEPWQVLSLRSEKYRVRERLSRYWNLHWLEEGRYRLRPKRDPASELRFELMFYKLIVS